MHTSSNSPVRPQYGSGQNGHHSYNVTSPSNSDGNHYQSPSISPGNWNVSSPSSTYAMVSPQSNASFQGSPSSATSADIRSSPPSTPPSSFQPPVLPTELGNQSRNGNSERNNKKAMETSNRRFFEKSAMDQERENIANRRVQSMMIEASRSRNRENNISRTNSRQSFGKIDAKSYLVADGKEAFATSSRKKKQPMIMEDLEGSVNDFKCGFDRDREKAAKKLALRIITTLDNAA